MPDTPSNLGSILLPKERGGWSLALEPIALALLVAPSAAGAALAVAGVAGFFTRRPLKLAVTSPLSDSRRTCARRWAALFICVVLAALAASAALGPPHALWPLLVAVPFAAAFLWYDLRQAMRETQAELAGCIAFALLPATFATLAGWPWRPAMGLAGLALARSVPTVLTIRTYLHVRKGLPGRASLAVAVAALAVIALALLAAQRLVPWAAPVLATLMLARTAFLTTSCRPIYTARRLGIIEAVLGVFYVGTLALAYRLR